MVKGIPNKKEGAPPNRAERRQAIKDEQARAKRAATATKAGLNSKNLPSWTKNPGIVAILFSFCGGAFILEIIANQSQNDSQIFLLLVPIVVLVVAGFGWWKYKVQQSLENGNKVSHSERVGPMERVHGKWRMRRASTTPGLLAAKTPIHSKERKPSKKYDFVPRAAIA